MFEKNNSWQIFLTLSKNPSKRFQIREIGRLTNISHTCVLKYLKELEKQQIVKKEKDGIYPSYKINKSSQYRNLKQISNIIEIRRCGLVEFLENNLFPDNIILFGSYLKGEDIETSDIDLFVLGEKKDLILKTFEQRLKRKIHLHIYEEIKQVPKELLNNIVNGFVLSGYLKIK